MMALMLLLISPINADDLSEEDSRKFDYFFMEACRLKMKGDLQKSGEMFQNCLQLDPQSAVSHFEVGKLLLMTGNENDALNFLKRAAVLNPKNDWYQVYLAGVYEHAKQYPQAIEVYEGLRNYQPEKVEYYYHLGDLYTKTQQFIKAIEIYDALEKQEGMDEALILEKQRLYLLAGEEKSALAELERLLKKYPKEERYLIMLGDYYGTLENYKKAMKAYNKAADLNPDNGYLHMSLSSHYEQLGEKTSAQKEMKMAFESQEIVYEQKMQILVQYMMMATKDVAFNLAVEELTTVLKTKYPEEANTYFFYANYLIQDTAKTEVVIDNLKTVVALDATNEDAWMQLVQLAFGNDNFAQVLRYTEDAELGGVKTPHIYFYRGIAAQQLKDAKKAKTAFETGVGITANDNPLKPQILGSLGDVSYELDAPQKAFGYYEAALALDGHNVMVMNNYAYYLSEMDTLLAKAETMSAKCIELEPGNPTYLDTYAWILYKRGNLLLAKFYMEKAVNNVPEPNDVLYDHFGDILFANGDKEEAHVYWQKAIDAGGDEVVLRRKMGR